MKRAGREERGKKGNGHWGDDGGSNRRMWGEMARWIAKGLGGISGAEFTSRGKRWRLGRVVA